MILAVSKRQVLGSKFRTAAPYAGSDTTNVFVLGSWSKPKRRAVPGGEDRTSWFDNPRLETVYTDRNPAVTLGFAFVAAIRNFSS